MNKQIKTLPYILLVIVVCLKLNNLANDFFYEIFKISLTLITLIMAMLIQVIIHETGHLVFGLLSGYKFFSLSILNFNIIKVNGKIKLKKLTYKIAGIGGQCLLEPPNLVDGKMPFKKYLLGGIIFNITSALIFISIYIFNRDVMYISAILIQLSLLGLYFGISNAIPRKTKMIHNDGYSFEALNKSKSELSAFWCQLKIEIELKEGKRLRDISKELIYFPKEKEKYGIIESNIGVYYVNQLIDLQEFKKAIKVIDKLLTDNYELDGINKYIIINEKIYCNLILKKSIEELYTEEQKLFMSQMKNYPPVARVSYAIELLHENNKEKADLIKERYNMIIESYPYEGDKQSEKELFNLITKQKVV